MIFCIQSSEIATQEKYEILNIKYEKKIIKTNQEKFKNSFNYALLDYSR